MEKRKCGEETRVHGKWEDLGILPGPTKIILPKYGKKKKKGKKLGLQPKGHFTLIITFIVPPSHQRNTYIPPPPFLN